MGSVGAHAQWKVSGAGSVERTRLYLVSTEDGRLTFGRTGPADAELVENADDRWEPTYTLTGQQLYRTGEGRLVITG